MQIAFNQQKFDVVLYYHSIQFFNLSFFPNLFLSLSILSVFQSMFSVRTLSLLSCKLHRFYKLQSANSYRLLMSQKKRKKSTSRNKDARLMRVVFLGTSSAQPIPLKRNVSCLVIQVNFIEISIYYSDVYEL